LLYKFLSPAVFIDDLRTHLADRQSTHLCGCVFSFSLGRKWAHQLLFPQRAATPNKPPQPSPLRTLRSTLRPAPALQTLSLTLRSQPGEPTRLHKLHQSPRVFTRYLRSRSQAPLSHLQHPSSRMRRLESMVNRLWLELLQIRRAFTTLQTARSTLETRSIRQFRL